MKADNYAKQRTRFPDPMHTLEDGILCTGGRLDVETLVEAYSFGIFPWPHEGYPMLWFSPPERGVLFLDEFKTGKTLRKQLKKQSFTVTENQSFQDVLLGCAEVPRPEQEGTWINEEIFEGYSRLHELGLAYSVEVWLSGKLVGGLYGTNIAGYFSAESMFFKESGASMAALTYWVEALRGRGQHWIDIQMVTPHLAKLGARYVSRKEFQKMVGTVRGK